MLPGELAPPQRDMHMVSRFVWLRSQAEGWWEPAVRVGDRVAAGEPLGTLRDLYGDVLERTSASEDGVVLFLTSSPAVAAEGVLLGLGAGLERV
jgi:uncharacterized protein